MRRFSFLIAVAVLAAAPPAFSQEENVAGNEPVAPGSGIVRQDFEAISPVTTVGSEQLVFDSHVSEYDLGWRESREKTSSRVKARGAEGASSVRVIRACELSLRLGDEDCAGN